MKRISFSHSVVRSGRAEAACLIVFDDDDDAYQLYPNVWQDMDGWYDIIELVCSRVFKSDVLES